MATVTDTVLSNNLTTAIGGAVPGAGDTLIIQQSYAAWQYTAGCNLGANSVALVDIKPSFAGSIATENLIILATTGTLRNKFSGTTMRIASTAAASVIQTLIHQTTGGGVTLYQTATFTTANCNGGAAVFASDTTITTGNLSAGVVELREGGGASTTLNVRGTAEVMLDRDCTTLNVYGGSVTINSTTCSPGTTAIQSGSITYKAVGSTGGTLNGSGGVCDFRLCGDVTFSGGTLMPGFRILKRPNQTIDVSACTDNGCEIITAA